MPNSLLTFNTTPVATGWNATVPIDYTLTTFHHALTQKLLATGNIGQTPHAMKVESEVGHFDEMLIWNEKTVIHELNLMKQQQALRPVCLRIIDNIIPSIVNFFSRPPATSPTPEQVHEHVLKIDRLEASADTFHIMCSGKGKQATQGSLQERLSISTHDMIEYVGNDSDGCLKKYHQRLQTHRNVADIAFLSENRNESEHSPDDMQAFDQNSFIHQSGDTAEATDSDSQQAGEVTDKSNAAVVPDAALQEAKQCVAENDQRIHALHQIRHSLLDGRSPLTAFSRWLNKLLRGR
ncbi:hypothetical protein [Erwinia sp. V71]|uniref:hypothetical protein n=1 Tax=Erwinia sp. V71 TaxID=3369424 RepID=UPI003F62A002